MGSLMSIRLYSNRSATTYGRREDKILSTLVSQFTSSYIFNWSKYFADIELKYAPAFDARVVLYPTDQNLKDYLSWRQADCHINNLYNTTFWLLVTKGITSHRETGESASSMTTNDAHAYLKGTYSKDKHEIMHEHGVNYNDEKDVYKKGSILIRMNVKKVYIFYTY